MVVDNYDNTTTNDNKHVNNNNNTSVREGEVVAWA